ncbi:hypothetical protein TRVL_05280 [Trypanosoma vivax]|nr:hypothetical protein TRVL_05280 [Trypanosoma vivax]
MKRKRWESHSDGQNSNATGDRQTRAREKAHWMPKLILGSPERGAAAGTVAGTSSQHGPPHLHRCITRQFTSRRGLRRISYIPSTTPFRDCSFPGVSRLHNPKRRVSTSSETALSASLR